MTTQTIGTQPAQLWKHVLTAPIITPDMAAAALTAMEQNRSRFVEAHRVPAERIATAAAEFARRDLVMRAELIMADISARQGASLITTAKTLENIRSQAAAERDLYTLARTHFLLTWISHALGDLPGARINGIRSIELLGDDAPPEVLIDHLMMLGVACGSGPEADRCYTRALDLAVLTGEAYNAIRVHNSIAFNACRAHDAPTAIDHVTRMMKLSQTRNLPLPAAPIETVARAYIMTGDYQAAADILAPVVRNPAETLGTGGGGVLYSGHYVLPECVITLAEAQRRLGNYAAAQQQLDAARLLTKEQDLRPSYSRILQEQARLYAAQGDFKQAYTQHRAFYRVIDELHSDEETTRARLVQASFDASEKKRDADQFRELAMRDALTGLYNRRYLDEHLPATIAENRGRALSVAIIDADFFKRINDECSHDIGDQVLHQLAAIMAHLADRHETVGRLGGEEFVLIMPRATAKEAWQRCETLRQKIAAYDWGRLTGNIPVTVSVGVTTSADGQTSASAILADADRHLYEAKRTGRNRVIGDR